MFQNMSLSFQLLEPFLECIIIDGEIWMHCVTLEAFTYPSIFKNSAVSKKIDDTGMKKSALLADFIPHGQTVH